MKFSTTQSHVLILPAQLGQMKQPETVLLAARSLQNITERTVVASPEASKPRQSNVVGSCLRNNIHSDELP